MNNSKQDNIGVVIKKLNKELTVKQQSIQISNAHEQRILNNWAKHYNIIVDILKTGCNGTRKPCQLKTVEGKWYKRNRVFNLTTRPSQQLLNFNLFDDETYDENEVNICLVKFVNGIATELRYNEEFYEEKYEAPIREEGIVIRKINIKLVNDAQKEFIRQTYMCEEEDVDLEWSNQFNTVANCVGFDIYEFNNIMGMWYTKDHKCFENNDDEDTISLDQKIDRLFAVQNLCDDNDECDETDANCLLVKIKDGTPIALRFNIIWIETEKEDQITEHAIWRDIYHEKLNIEKSQFDNIAPKPTTVDNSILGNIYNSWIQEYEDDDEEDDDEITLGDACDVYETEVAEKSLWGTFKTWLSSSWTGFKRLFGW